MVERIRAVLVSSYAGAIMVGWTLAQGVATVIAVVLVPIANIFVRYSNRQRLGTYPPFSEPKIFDPFQLGVGAIKAVVVLAIGLLLLKWIYLPENPSIADEVPDSAE